MPAPRKSRQQQAPKYKDSDASHSGEDFEDSGSEASIPQDEASDNDSDVSSGDEFKEESFNKSSQKSSKARKKPPVIPNKTKKSVFGNNLSKSLKKISASSGINQNFVNISDEPEILISVKDLTEQEKLLPSFLNLSESDSDDSDDDNTSKKRRSSYTEPIDYHTFVEKKEYPVAGGSNIIKMKESISAVSGRLSDSDSNSDMEEVANATVSKSSETGLGKPVTSKKINFQHLQDHTLKLEEAKKSLDMYNKNLLAAKQDSLDVNSLLAIGEPAEKKTSPIKKKSAKKKGVDSDSDDEDLEEVKGEQKSQPVIPKSGLELILDLPTDRPKPKNKALDLEMMMKRRLNRVKKEYQVYMHKVHILCWISHGTFVNSMLNHESVMAAALSLIPSEQCYPSNRIDMKYLEQITKWYSGAITLKEEKSELKFKPNKRPLNLALLQQIDKKTVPHKKYMVYIFICMLRALGIKCRLVLSIKVVPLRPPEAELCSLSKNKGDSKDSNTEEKSKHFKKTNSESKSKPNAPSHQRISFKHTHSISKISQLDGADDRDMSKGKSRASSRKTNAGNKSLTLNKISAIKQSPDSKIAATSASTCDNMSYWDKITQNIIEPDNETRISHKDLRTPNSRNINIKKEIKRENPSIERSMNSSIDKTIELPGIPTPPTIIVRKSIALSKEFPDIIDKLTTKRTITKRILVEESICDDSRKNDTTQTIVRKSVRCSTATKRPRESTVTESVSQGPSRKPTPQKDTNHLSSSTPPVNKVTNVKAANKKTRTEKLKEGGQELVLPRRSTRGSSVSSNGSAGLDQPSTSTGVVKRVPRSTNVRKKSIATILSESLEKSNKTSLKPNTNPRSKISKSNTDKVKSVSSPKESEYFKNSSPKTTGGKKASIGKRVSHRDLVINDTIAKEIRKSQPTNVTTKSTTKKPVSKGKKKSGLDNDYVPDDEEVKVRGRNRKESTGSDADFKPINKRVSGIKTVKDKRVLSTDEEDSVDLKKKALDVWCEVYVEEEEQWVSVDVFKGQVHCTKEIYSRATHPVSYIVAYDQAGYLKDVTRRYVPHWNTTTRKLRTSPDWYETALKPWMAPQHLRDVQEDKQLDRIQFDAPLPTIVGEYKNHPLYALKRHLLKFEVIYPPDAMTLGFVRNEPVYSRDCIHTCRSRETWVKEARVVRAGEQPYKIVKARPKYDRMSGKMITDIPLEIFGPWQCDDYEPEVAEGGKVPRNAYGNVELFKPTMLPKGTVHLRLTGLTKVARKLGIDCAPAMTGFDYHSGWSHPVYDGFVVCEEFEETIVEAWEQEQHEAEERAREKIDKRVYGNWRRLIRGLFIRERLKAKYDFQSESTPAPEVGGSKPNKRSKGPRFVAKKRKSCEPNSESD